MSNKKAGNISTQDGTQLKSDESKFPTAEDRRGNYPVKHHRSDNSNVEKSPRLLGGEVKKMKGDELERIAHELQMKIGGGSVNVQQGEAAYLHTHYYMLFEARSAYLFDKHIEDTLVKSAENHGNSWLEVIGDLRNRISAELHGVVNQDSDACFRMSILSLSLSIAIDALNQYGDGTVISNG